MRGRAQPTVRRSKVREMAQEERGELIVGLDIGTTKICAVVGEVHGGKVDIIGIGTHPSIGLRRGWWSISRAL